MSNELLGLMSLRYSDSSGRVSFPSLVCFLMRLEAMASKWQLGDMLETFPVRRGHRRGPGQRLQWRGGLLRNISLWSGVAGLCPQPPFCILFSPGQSPVPGPSFPHHPVHSLPLLGAR